MKPSRWPSWNARRIDDERQAALRTVAAERANATATPPPTPAEALARYEQLKASSPIDAADYLNQHGSAIHVARAGA